MVPPGGRGSEMLQVKGGGAPLVLHMRTLHYNCVMKCSFNSLHLSSRSEMALAALVVAAAIFFQLLGGEGTQFKEEEKQLLLDNFNYIRAENHRNQLVSIR